MDTEPLSEDRGQWVSVTQWLPRFGDWCLVVYSGVVQRQAARLEANAEWSWADETADNAPFNAITHWRPLPEPPKESSDGH
jgi:hypothetical protein